ncbi:MAG TPA: GspH/FimT family pseudopilin [Sedimentisphaerales bacterium]|nr:GspH/FimT family pseudopilin [Phycisphaerae bacterium]HON90792.1 GspH/FimT family pseudopilin [Sedimentisphaerales bacterium]HQI28861.1 GspH/FimT family pseudopilin [Sedimentisphaerales bacterium]
MTPQSRQLDSRKGLTLLELILVMVILSTVLAMAAPSLRGFFASRRGDDAAAQILALTQFARSQAISEGLVYRLNFDTRERTCWLTVQKAGTFERLETSFGKVYTVPKDLVIVLENIAQKDREVYVEFTPYGTVTPALIRLIDRRGRALEIACPTVTESFSITESDRIYTQYAAQ